MTRDWQQVAAEKRLQQERAIVAISDTLIQEEPGPDPKAQKGVKKATDVEDTATLAGMLASGEVTSEEIAKAYIMR